MMRLICKLIGHDAHWTSDPAKPSRWTWICWRCWREIGESDYPMRASLAVRLKRNYLRSTLRIVRRKQG